jgi:uncharacterized protein (TIGR04255 family)
MPKKLRMKKARTICPADLPNFAQPPLYELALSIQFARQIRSIDVGVIWRLFRDQYPRVEEQAPLAPVYEKFGLPPTPIEIPQFMFSTTPEVLRYWFVDKDGNELLQVQSDRLIHNWRKNSPEATYPRYEPVRARFKMEVQKVNKFLESEDLGEIKPNQCEVTYINHISFGDEVEPEDKFDHIFTVWQEAYSDNHLKRIERGQFGMTYVIPGEHAEPLGRLHVQAQSAIVRTTSKRIIQFSLTVRGKPKNNTIESAFEWLDKGREVIVRSFTALTRKEMHRMWGRTDG